MGDDDRVDLFMPLWIADYLGDTQELTCEEHGAYLLLLMTMWRRGGQLPVDHDRLARIVAGMSRERWDAIWRSLQRFFDVANGTMTQRRLTRELARAKAKRQQAREHGRAAANARWGNAKQDAGALPEHSAGSAGAKPEECYPESEPEPSSSAPPTPPPSPRRRGAARRGQGEGVFENTLAAFCTAWEERYRAAYVPTRKGRSLLGGLLKNLAPDVVAALPGAFRNYLRDSGRWAAEEHRHSLEIFCANINKYRVSSHVAGLSDRDIRVQAAGQAFLEMDLEGLDGRAR